MSTSRDVILRAARANAPAAVPLPALPSFEDGLPPPLARFRSSLELLGGNFIDCPPGTDPNRRVRELFPDARVICSNAPEVFGTKRLEEVREDAELEDVDVAVVRAAFAVAETGSIFLSEAELGINVLGFLAQHLVALLDPADILGNLHQAYRHPAFATARYAVLMSGPSATADIEGVLIRGAQGVRSLKVLSVPRRAA